MKKTVCLVFILFIGLMVPWEKGDSLAWGTNFNDMNNHWAAAQVNQMAAKGIIQGDQQGRFNPNQPISRQEVVTMLIRLLAQEDKVHLLQPGAGSGELTAKGLSPWAMGHLILARELNMVTDHQVRVLAWDEAATREEVALWLAKTIGIQPVPTNDLTGYLARFNDAHQLNFQEAPYLMALVRDNLLVGKDGGIKPGDEITRAEAAVLLSRADQYQLSHTGWSGANQQGSSIIRGTLKRIDWINRGIELEIGGNSLNFSLTTSLINQLNQTIWQQPLVAGDQVELLLVNGVGTSLTATGSQNPNTGSRVDDRSDQRSRGSHTVYKGTLSWVSSRQDSLTLRSGTVRYLDNRSWHNLVGQHSKDIGSWTEVYYHDTKIRLDQLDRYEGNTIYLAYDNDRQEVTMIRIQRGSEQTYFERDIDWIDARNNKLEISGTTRTFVYDQGTIVLIDGNLMRAQDLLRDDKVNMISNYHNGTYQTAVVEVRDNRSRSGSRTSDELIVYRGELDIVHTSSDRITIRNNTLYRLDGSSWRSDSRSRNFYLESRVELYHHDGSIRLGDLDYYEGDTIYLVYDSYWDEVVKILVQEGTEIYRGRYEIRDINTSRREIDFYNISPQIYYNTSTIAIIDNELVDPRDLRHYEEVYLVVNRLSSSDNRAAIMVLR